MAYEFTIADQGELTSLSWIANRYDYAAAIEDALDKAISIEPDGWEKYDGPYPVVFTIPEHKAWEIQTAIEAEDGYLTCLGGRLKDEVQALLAKIV